VDGHHVACENTVRMSTTPPLPAAILPPPRLGAVEWGLLAVLSLLWGGSFLFGRIAVAELPPMTVAWVRVALAAAVLLVGLLLTGAAIGRALPRWRDFLVMGLVNNVIPFSLIFWGQTAIGAGLAAVLNATTPLFAAVIAHLGTSDEKLTGNRIAGLLIGIAGVAVLIGPETMAGFGKNVWALLAVLGAALSYGFAGFWGRRFRGLPPGLSALSQLSASTLLLLPLVLVFDQPFDLPMPSPKVIAAILALAVLSTALAYIVFFRIIVRAGGSNVMLVTLMIPPSAMLLGWLVLGETLSAGELAGAAVIGLALLVIDGRLLPRLGLGSAAPTS
jgi:drug/metabolite transporter (DMT)-like permease